MDVLVIGGSVFLGRAVVDQALAAGHRVTMFNRGVSGGAPDGVEQVRGDRTVRADLEQLAGRRFDLVVDTCGYVPKDVGAAAEILAPSCDFYAFVSSINAYPGWPADRDYHDSGLHDGDPDATRADVPEGMQQPDASSDVCGASSGNGDGRASERSEEVSPYGWLKVGCELAVTRAFGDGRRSILRGGLIVGPHDSAIGRLPWWIDRVARGGEVLVPGSPDDGIAFIDARDLARFALTCVPGEFETPGPTGRDTRADLMTACKQATGSDATLTYVDDAWLAEQGVEYWTEVPLWIPQSIGPSVFHHHSAEAEAAGLSWRPLAETVADTWAWQRSVSWQPSEMTPGLAPDRETELLAAWRAR